MTKLTKASEYPKDTKYLLIVFGSYGIYHEGDERSRTNPGHGYPAYTETVYSTNIHPFADMTLLKKEVERMLEHDPKMKDYLILEVSAKLKVIKSIALDVTSD